MNGETVLCIAPRAWHSLWRESQQIMWRIAKQNRVLYFEPGRDSNGPLLTEMWRNLPNFFALRAHELHQNLIVIPTPAQLPVGRRYLPRSLLRLTTPWVAKINARVRIRHVRWAMKSFGVENPILWLYWPYDVDMLGQFGEKLACYHNYDELPDFLGNNRVKDLLRRYDDKLSSQADVIFATSQAQTNRRKAVNSSTYFVPNGVDFDLFNHALDPDLPLPADISAVPRPIIGFAGWLGYHIDAELLCRVAEAYPNCSLVFVGPDELSDATGRQRLRVLPNVFFLGRKEHHELPAYLRAFNVALMPWLLTGHLRSAYPLKLHEYLAAGRAVVAVALPELRPYRHVVRIAETHDQFIQQIQEALHDDSPLAIQARVDVARENTWDHRVAKIYQVLGNHLDARAETLPL